MLSSLSHLEFLALAKTHSRIIVFKETYFDYFGAVESFTNIQAIDTKAVLLETADPENKHFITTTIASRPTVKIVIKNDQCELIRQNSNHSQADINPLTILRDAHRQYQVVSSQTLPGVIGGSFGFISYESVKHLPGMTELQQSDHPDYIFRSMRARERQARGEYSEVGSDF